MSPTMLRRGLRHALRNGRRGIVWATVVWAVFCGTLVGPNIVLCFEHDGSVAIEYATAHCCTRCDPSDGDPAGAVSVNAACDGPREFACELCACIRPGYVAPRSTSAVRVASAFLLAPDVGCMRPASGSHDAWTYATVFARDALHALQRPPTPLRC